MDVQDIFETLTDPGAPGGGTENEYLGALRMLDAYFLPQVNVPYKRHVFRQMKQEDHETVDQFVVRLSNPAVIANLVPQKMSKYVIKLLTNASPQSFGGSF